MNPADVRRILATVVSTLSRRGNVYTAKKSYFWGATVCGAALADVIVHRIPQAKIIETGNHFKPFHGGAKRGSRQDSYLWCKFSI